MEGAMTKSEMLMAIAALPEGDPKFIAAEHALSGKPTVEPPASLRLFRPGDAARALGVSRPTLWRMTKENRIKHIVLRKDAIRYSESELRRLVKGE
jgi:predicted DNA-binding transcriptional regulator AlpA